MVGPFRLFITDFPGHMSIGGSLYIGWDDVAVSFELLVAEIEVGVDLRYLRRSLLEAVAYLKTRGGNS